MLGRESNIRRWLIENDWLEAIVALPLNLFYNTGIATYIWVLSNRKPAHRRGKIQLIDATKWFKPLKKNLGKKNCELAPADIARITQVFHKFEETPESKIFSNEAFGYRKVPVERPLRLHSQLTLKGIETLRFSSGQEEIRSVLYEDFGETFFREFEKVSVAVAKRLDEWGSDEDSDVQDDDGEKEKRGLPEKTKKKLLDAKSWRRDARLVEVASTLRKALGDNVFEDHNVFRRVVADELRNQGIKLSVPELKAILKAVSWRVETAPPVIAKTYKLAKKKADPIRGLYEGVVDSKPVIIEYESDSELRDAEQVPLLEDGGVEAFMRREVLPYASDAWMEEDGIKTGYEISFTRHFYKPQALRTLEDISADIIPSRDAAAEKTYPPTAPSSP